jgi:flagellin
MKGVDAESAHPEVNGRASGSEKGRGLGWAAEHEKELSPMALGVLNNLSAVYAENNLNKTNSSLQTVLQQLSSGSRINSGADDAAGLSLVNGLAANSAALSQSATNATEGVGFLQVADGALSQITSLLNRAITLATEASNGTLNSTQEAAADQEYQSLLAEITNIGSTTTYNQQQVFSGKTVSIYTGDSSSTGASVDNLNLRAISSSSVGDTDGSMSYANATAESGTETYDLGTGAATSDSLSATLSSFTYKDSSGATQTISISPADAKVSSLMTAINAKTTSTGISASFSGTTLTITGSNVSSVQLGSLTDSTITGSAVTGTQTNTAATVATISYSDSAGVSLSGTDLTSQSNAQSALTLLNSAVSAVSSMDGYIGAQINTLNSINTVMTTQQQDVISAQNAIQATDYASATSDMSKYEVLSQTGIAALAQANSVQQEVTKLLQ